MKAYCTFVALFIVIAFERVNAQELPDLSSIPMDIVVPAMSFNYPIAGRRVKQTTPGWENTDVYHALYLPENWKPGYKFPVIVEYPGNGLFRNRYGDVCNGTVEECSLGYGLSGGLDFIWVCLPFINVNDGAKSNAIKWWGDVAETKRYVVATLDYLAKAFGADTGCIILSGFSRGAIACNYIGLNDDKIAAIWTAFFCHSHYDGVYEDWPYPDADRVSALQRLKRLNERPQWISHEGGIKDIQNYLLGTEVKSNLTFQSIPFRNHSDHWILRDIPVRRAARSWLHQIVKNRADLKHHTSIPTNTGTTLQKEE